MSTQKRLLEWVVEEWEKDTGTKFGPNDPYPLELWEKAVELVETGETELPNGKILRLKEVTV